MSKLSNNRNELKCVKAEDFCLSVRDGTHDSPKPVAKGFPLVTSKHLKSGQIEIDSCYQVSEDDYYEIIKRSEVNQWDVLISMIGTIGEVALVQNQPHFAIKNVGLFKSRDEVDGKWLYYYLSTAFAQNYLREISRGTTQQYVPLGSLREMPIYVFKDKSEMSRIVHILGTLDDKIENNHKMAKTLEAIAQAIFKSWFVDFDPVRAKMAGESPESICKRLKLTPEILGMFPDQLVDSELGKIPEGWGVSKIGDLAAISSGKRPKKRYEHPSDEIKIPLWGGNGPIGFVDEPLISSPCILTGRVGTLGTFFRVDSPCWPSDNTLIIRPKQEYNFEFIFLSLLNLDISSLNRGSTQPLLTQSDLKKQLIMLPSFDVLEQFHYATQLLYNHSHLESLTLTKIRDLLLPKLMSGKIRVPVGDANE